VRARYLCPDPVRRRRGSSPRSRPKRRTARGKRSSLSVPSRFAIRWAAREILNLSKGVVVSAMIRSGRGTLSGGRSLPSRTRNFYRHGRCKQPRRIPRNLGLRGEQGCRRGLLKGMGPRSGQPQDHGQRRPIRTDQHRDGPDRRRGCRDAQVPVGFWRYGEPEEVAGAVAYLAGPEAGYITASTITIDGGLSILGRRTAFPHRRQH